MHYGRKILALFIIMVTLLIAAVYFAYKPSSEFYGHVFTSGKTNEKIIALTFDDGPNGQATLQTLEILKKENIKATFFLVGDNVKYYPAIARRVVADGHEVGNHSMHHAHLLQLETSNEIKDDLAETNQAIFGATGQTPKFFRPPFGFRSPFALKAARRLGMVTVTWSDLTNDYNSKSDLTIQKYIELYAKPGGIIVLHDGLGTKHVDRPVMLKALPSIIKTLKDRGYTFVTVSELYDRAHVK
jgi:peptidoglycan/xylan/chitin deacetylase (PgdA/CDA1 family)